MFSLEQGHTLYTISCYTDFINKKESAIIERSVADSAK